MSKNSHIVKNFYPFEKIVVFTDIHYGLRNNERKHNAECEEFIKWMLDEAEQFGAHTTCFMGDWHHHRASIQTSTLNYSHSGFEIISKRVKQHFQIVGNHDLFYKDKREINSVEFCRNFANIHLVNDIQVAGDAVFAPWLVGTETKKVSKFEQPYVFGHFEFPNFLMNAMVAMPDTGHIHIDNFDREKQTIFSGHFHKRQIQTNIHGNQIIYIGNCFPHNFSDVGDDDRGIMLLEFGKPPIYKKWPNAPKYRNLLLSELLENPEKHIDHLTKAKITIDVDISYEEANFIRETMVKDYGARELQLLPTKHIDQEVGFDENIKFETVDQIVTEQLSQIDSNTLDKNLLVEIYNLI